MGHANFLNKYFLFMETLTCVRKTQISMTHI